MPIDTLHVAGLYQLLVHDFTLVNNCIRELLQLERPSRASFLLGWAVWFSLTELFVRSRIRTAWHQGN